MRRLPTIIASFLLVAIVTAWVAGSGGEIVLNKPTASRRFDGKHIWFTWWLEDGGTLNRRWELPFWKAATLAAAYPAWQLSRALASRSGRRPTQLACPRCGYDLRATPQRCPECGNTTSGGTTIAA